MVKRKGNAMSKTKALATRRKTGPTFKAKTEGSPKEVLLSQLMEQYVMDSESSLSFTHILSGLGMNDRNTGWRNAWKALHQEGFTEQASGGGGAFYTSGFCLTAKGREEASTEEYKELMKKTSSANMRPKTNEELHERIKGRLMNDRGGQIFDLLLQHGPLSRKELAKRLGISDTGAYFSYALQQLKDLGYAENVGQGRGGKKVRLTDQAFVEPVNNDHGEGAVSRASSESAKPTVTQEDEVP